MSSKRKIQHPRTYRGRKKPEKRNINAIFLRYIPLFSVHSKLHRQQNMYINVVSCVFDERKHLFE